MAADDQIKCGAQIFIVHKNGQQTPVSGVIDYQDLDETDPKTQVYLNGGAPDGGGKRRMTHKISAKPGESILIKLKNRMGSNKILDSTGSTSGVFLLGVRYRDLYRNIVDEKDISEADRAQVLVADDSTVVNGKFSDAYDFTVPDGEEWFLFGRWQANFRTTA